MAFKGDLTNISLFDVFQTLSQNRQTGVLVLNREGVTKKIFTSPEGVRLFFTRSFRPLKLGEIFVRRGRITAQDVEILLLEQKKDYRPFGQLLVESGKVSDEEVAQVLRYHAEDEIFEAFSWDSGGFAFYDGQDAGDSTTPLSEILMDPAGLCLEAARRLDEMERLRDFIPNTDEYYVRAAGVPVDPEQFEPVVAALYSQLIRPHSVDELRDLIGVSLYDLLKSLHKLVEGGLIRPLLADELLEASDRARDSGRLEDAAQLLKLALRREPHDRNILEAYVQAIERLGQPRRLAKMLGELGQVCLAQGEIEDAVEHLEQALRHDPANMEVLCSLRDAFAKQEDLERFAELSLKIARAHAEKGNLPEGIEACRDGLEAVPGAISLRFYYGQLLARTDQLEEAQAEIRGLIRSLDNSGRSGTDRGHELITNCYRLLLKIDPNDDEAQSGLRDLDRRRMSSIRRRRFLVRGSVAAAIMLIAVGVGITVAGPSAESLYEQFEEARNNGDNARASALINQLTIDYPESEEAQRALRYLREVDQRSAAQREALKRRQEQLKSELQADFEDVKAGLADLPYLEAVRKLQPLLARLDRPETKSLRKALSAQIEYELLLYLEKIGNEYEADRKQVSGGMHQTLNGDRNAGELLVLETKLAQVRQRAWPTVLPELLEVLDDVATSPHVGKAGQGIDEFRKRIKGASTAFSGIDALYYTVRRERLRLEIQELVRKANRQGLEYLRECRFPEARALYQAAYTKADRVTDEQPREHFRKLLHWLDRERVLPVMRNELEKIDNVVATLQDVERLRSENQADTAYRLLRDLVSTYRLIEFERKYMLPYRVDSTPQGADVLVDGEPAGKTPCAIEMPIGLKPVRVTLKRPGFEVKEVELVPTDDTLNGRLAEHLVKEMAWDHELSGAVEARPVVAGDKLLLATNRATLRALRLSDGSRAWEADPQRLDRITARPVVDGDHAYFVTVSGHVYRVRLEDGAITARIKLPGQVYLDPALADGTLYVATRKPNLVAIRGKEQVYDVPLAFVPTTALVVSGDSVCAGTAEGVILVHDRATGAEKRRLKAPSGSSFFGGIAAFPRGILGGAEDGKLYAFDPGEPAPLWVHPTPNPIHAAPASAGTVIYLPSRDGNIHSLGLDGELILQYEVGPAVETTPVLADGFLYAMGGNRVRAFDTRGEILWWDRGFRDEFPVHVVAGGGYVVVVTNRPWVYAFAKDVR